MEEKKLERFSKAEIIEAIRSISALNPKAITIEKLIINNVERKRQEKDFATAKEARETAIERMSEYCEWKQKMIEKYGNGKSVQLRAIPLEEIRHGAKIEKAWLDSEKARKRAEKKEDMYFRKEN